VAKAAGISTPRFNNEPACRQAGKEQGTAKEEVREALLLFLPSSFLVPCSLPARRGEFDIQTLPGNRRRLSGGDPERSAWRCPHGSLALPCKISVLFI
jgi:hypothetical protein